MYRQLLPQKYQKSHWKYHTLLSELVKLTKGSTTHLYLMNIQHHNSSHILRKYDLSSSYALAVMLAYLLSLYAFTWFTFGTVLFHVEARRDFILGTDKLKFGVGQHMSCSNVSIVKDDDIEPSETFTVSLLRSPDLDPRIVLNPDIATVEILDNDGIHARSSVY